MSKRNHSKHKKLIELLQKSVQSVAKLLSEGNLAGAIDILIECQNSAIVLGGHIEKLHGLQTQTVVMLEQYCNVLYEVSSVISQDGACDAETLANALDELSFATNQISETYDAEFPERKEVVFLPYNASMWDSLESVWKAADADPNCDAYVIPIPYYDLDANRNFIKKHYEGDLYPDYVPITNYEDYDLEERHPDMIFIHNPYDEGNRVTSIAPEFYSSRIKNYTEKLVYIPYFVLAEINPKNQAAIEGMKRFCTLPGVLYADQVIVQSEDMRQIYINEYMKAIKAVGGEISRKELEKKILGLGSPKFDKAVNTKKEDLEIPEEWLRIIEKPDGTWKKIIFYNTSIAAFLKDSEQMLVKIQDVLRTFKENKDDVALLWRPHPLMMQTIESMRPQLRDAYLEIVQQYREEGWGIYDDSADMDRAVVLSDAYYGDHSSVVQVYQETGKPVIYQDISTYEKSEEVLSTECLYDDGEYLWAVHTDFNGLFRIDKKDLAVEFIGHVPGEQIIKERLYTDIVECNNKLYLCPFNANEIAEYDKCSHTFKKIRINHADTFSGKCFKAVSIANSVYFIPYFYDEVICYNTEKETLSYIGVYKDKISKKIKTKNSGYFICAEVMDNKIILPYSCTNSVLEIDVLSNRASLIENVGDGKGFVGIIANNEILYYITSSGEVERAEEYSNVKNLMKIPEETLYPVVRMGDNVCMFPHVGGSMFELSMQKESLKRKEVLDAVKLKIGFWRTVQAISIGQDNVYMCIGNSSYLVQMDGLFENAQYKKLVLKKEDADVIKQNIQKNIREHVLVKEGVCISLFDMIGVANKDVLSVDDKEIGSKIFGCLVKGDKL